MFPAILDLSVMRAAVAGSGPAAARRVRLLDEAGARHLRVFAPQADAGMKAAAGSRLEARFPEEAEIAPLHIVFTAGLAEEDAGRIARWARRHGVLVNTEDVAPLCDFHVPAMVRRGDLLLTVSTGGKSPGLARRLRRELEHAFGPDWAGRLGELAQARDRWRGEGAPLEELARRTEALIEEKEWLP
ncbi:MAG: bifunctional precorrin-2 dehydrogenase/sirohydrochlorin ferrochelatase [Alphaproteobacteria bacterium]